MDEKWRGGQRAREMSGYPLLSVDTDGKVAEHAQHMPTSISFNDAAPLE